MSEDRTSAGENSPGKNTSATLIQNPCARPEWPEGDTDALRAALRRLMGDADDR